MSPRLTSVIAEIGTSGTMERFTLTSHAGDDIARAVELEHPCTDTACDIRAALDNGYPYSAAYLLAGATETPLLDAVCHAHGFNPSATYDEIPDWLEWETWFRANSLECGCGSFSFRDEWSGYPSHCGNCGNEFPSADETLQHLEDWRPARVRALLDLHGLEDEARAELYRRNRERHGYAGALAAWRWAGDKLETITSGPDFTADDLEEVHTSRGTILRARFTFQGFDVSVSIDLDDWFEDMSGEWTNAYSPGAVEITEGLAEYHGINRRETYAYFIPQVTYSEHRDALRKLGHSRHESDCLARSYVLRDFRYALRNDRCAYVLDVTASRNGVELGSSSCGGFDVNPDDSWSVIRAYLVARIVEDGMITEAVSQARATLADLVESVR
jgi:hypothetical protein